MKTKPLSTTARTASLDILNALDQGDDTLDNILEEMLSRHAFFSKKDRALLQAVVYGVLRWRARLDWIIAHFSETALNRINPKVMNILRIGLFQIICLDRIPVSAAVNTSVEMAKSITEPYVVRYVNGLLRNAARKYQQVPYPDAKQDPLLALEIQKSFPDWIVKRWINRFGLEDTGLLCDAVNTIPPLTIRCNTLKTDRRTLLKYVERDVDQAENTSYSPDGLFLSNPRRSIPKIRAFEDGMFQVQDEAAQLVTFLLHPLPGETVLDACAGLGGKTGHIAQMMENRGKLIAMDNSEKKLSRLLLEMHRLGISLVTTHIHDLRSPPDGKCMGKFDRILLDAPCSGLGVLRRNPDAKWRTKERDLTRQSRRQAIFLDNLAYLVKPNGILVFCVCSMEPEENESVINGFLNKHRNFAIENNRGRLPDKARALLTGNGYLKTFPHLHNMDGFFAVCMKRVV
jgi:16S rRNA (cytosine967-C5)-methyltransferase